MQALVQIETPIEGILVCLESSSGSPQRSLRASKDILFIPEQMKAQDVLTTRDGVQGVGTKVKDGDIGDGDDDGDK